MCFAYWIPALKSLVQYWANKILPVRSVRNWENVNLKYEFNRCHHLEKKSHVGLFHTDRRVTQVLVFRNVISSYERFSEIHYNVYNCWLVIRNILTSRSSYLPTILLSFASTGTDFDVFFLEIHCKLQMRHSWISSELRECLPLRISRSWFPTAPYPRVGHQWLTF